MGRPPSNGTPSFRFHPTEVVQMKAILQQHEGHVPPRDLLVALAERFSHSPERAGKIVVQMKQIWNWFQNRRYALRAKLGKPAEKSTTSPITRDEVTPVRNVSHVPQQMVVSSGQHVVRYASEAPTMEFEAKSAGDGAWYDVQAFLSHRYLETGNPEVLVRFTGFGMDEEEWLNIRKHVRQRSLPCEAPECIAVLPGDTVLCFQEGKEQALYFDAHVLDAQRRRHDVRGCRCRFLVRYDHDQSEEIVPLRKMCRRPETDYRLQVLHATNEASSSLGMTNPNPSTAPIIDIAVPFVGSLSTTPFPTLDQAPNPSLTSDINPTYVPAPATVFITETSAPVPEQNKVENDIPAQIAAPVVLNKVETDSMSQIPIPVTEPNKIETDNPDLVLESNTPVSVPEPIKVENDYPVSVPEPEKTVEMKKAETNEPETVALTGSSVSEGQISGDLVVSVPGLEKDESGTPGVGPETVSTVEMKE